MNQYQMYLIIFTLLCLFFCIGVMTGRLLYAKQLSKELNELEKNINSSKSKSSTSCMVCDDIRTNKCISIKQHDLSKYKAQHYILYVRYCNDRQGCCAVAEIPEIWINWPEVTPKNLERKVKEST